MDEVKAAVEVRVRNEAMKRSVKKQDVRKKR